jgi:predicted ATP-grasp superfamily ATP-dependent carboligase
MLDLRRFHPERPPALLLGGLNLVRALGLGGIPVIVASPQPDWPALSSRYAQGRLILPPGTALAEALLAAGERLSGALGRKIPLFYGDDDYLNVILEHREALARYFAFVVNEPAVARALIEKDQFEAFAQRRGLPVPRTLAWEDLETWYSPVIAKPRVKIGYDDSAIFQRLFGGAGKARIFASGPELTAMPLAWQLREGLVIQEYVPGDDRHLWSFHGYADEKGELLAAFIGRKIRTWPASTGVSSFLELVHNDAFLSVGREVAARVPLRGVFKMDFKRDDVSGAWRLLEVNARYNLWHHLGAANGINLPRIAYDYLVHGKRPQAAPRYRTTHRWLSLRPDYRAYRELAARGELTLAAWLRSILEAPRVCDVFSWSDPAPFAREFLGRWRARIPRLRARITARLVRWLSTAS